LSVAVGACVLDAVGVGAFDFDGDAVGLATRASVLDTDGGTVGFAVRVGDGVRVKVFVRSIFGVTVGVATLRVGLAEEELVDDTVAVAVTETDGATMASILSARTLAVKLETNVTKRNSVLANRAVRWCFIASPSAKFEMDQY